MDIGEKLVERFLGVEESSIDIKIADSKSVGNICFCIPLDQFTCDKAISIKLQKSHTPSADIGLFYVDMIGEMIVRKCISIFIDNFVNVTDEEYRKHVSTYNHVHFGIAIRHEHVFMQFHMSLLNKILVDTFFSLADGDQS